MKRTRRLTRFDRHVNVQTELTKPRWFRSRCCMLCVVRCIVCCIVYCVVVVLSLCCCVLLCSVVLLSVPPGFSVSGRTLAPRFC